MEIRKLILKDVRCFAGRQEFDICPLTFLVGENSTGKTTVLGCLQAVYDFMCRKGYNLNFNVDPYPMGAFSNLVRRSNPTIKQFLVGLELQASKKKEPVEYTLNLVAREEGSEPVIKEQKIVTKQGEAYFYRDDREVDSEKSTQYDDSSTMNSGYEIVDCVEESGYTKSTLKEARELRLDLSLLDLFRSESVRTFGSIRDDRSKSVPKNVRVFEKFRNVVSNLLDVKPSSLFFSNSRFLQPDIVSIAPVRSKPQRTYNPFKEEENPEGIDIPMLIMNMSRANKDRWGELRDRLIEFGKSSGLFTDVNVRRLGKSIGDPYQLQIKVKGPKVNFTDVGYGVSQILPILVRIYNAYSKTVFLMQQPEVHLHPKGQAELSSMLIETIKSKKHRYVIETHSDAMVNRARIEIMNGVIAAQDVSLIYLEPVGNQVRVHNISFDRQGNLIGAPPGYRNFFINESDRLLGFTN